MKFKWIVAFSLCMTLFAAAENDAVSRSLALQDDYNDGLLTRAEFVAYQLMGIKNSKELPQRYQAVPQEPSRRGTGFMLEAAALVHEAEGSQKALLKSALMRPDNLPLSFISPSGRFKLHYTDTGYDAATDTFIVQAASAFDYSYDVIVNKLGFDAPPQDDVEGPEYDVYIYNLGDYGMTTPDGAASTEAHPNGAYSYIHMDNSFQRTYTKGIDGMLVTTAHEFLHMVQIGYRNFTTSELDSRWLFEGCAVWMEDYAFDDINDYFQYLPSYYNSLDESFYKFNGRHEYGTGIFYMMLEEKHGADIIRSIWQNFSTLEAFDAVDEALRQKGSSFALELNDHMVWNYFTGERAFPEMYYDEGENYPLLQADQTDSISTELYISNSTNLLGAHIIEIEPQVFGELSIQPDFASPYIWLYSVIEDAGTGTPLVFSATGDNSVLLPDVSPASSIFLIPTNVHVPQTIKIGDKDDYAFKLTLGDIGPVKPGIQSIAPNPFQPDLHSQGASIKLRLTERTEKIEWYVTTETGQVVYSESIDFNPPKMGNIELKWYGRANNGHMAASGIYLIFIDAGQDIEPAKIAVVR